MQTRVLLRGLRRLGLSLLLPLICCAVAGAEDPVYRSVDREGNPVFSDVPSDDARPVEIGPANVMPAPAVNAPATTGKNREIEHLPYYQTLQITAPQNEETISNTGGTIAVEVLVDPPLLPGHGLRLLLDDEPTGETQQQSSFSVSGVFHGEHRLRAQVVDADERVLRESEAVAVYLHQRSSVTGESLRKNWPSGQPRPRNWNKP